jgi:hypothetical protein
MYSVIRIAFSRPARAASSARAGACVAILLASTVLAAQDKTQLHLLRLQFRPGTSQFSRDTLETRALKAGLDVALHCELTREIRVGRLGPRGAELELATRRVVARGTEPEDIDYDSEASGIQLPAVLRHSIASVGTTVRCTMDERGQFASYEGPVSVPGGQTLFVGYDGANAAAGCLPGLPEAPIAVGATWPSEATLAFVRGSGCKVQLNCRLAKVEHGRATIEQTMDVVANDVELRKLVPTVRIDSLTSTCVLELASGRMLMAETRLLLTPDTGVQRAVTIRTESIEPPASRRAAK